VTQDVIAEVDDERVVLQEVFSARDCVCDSQRSTLIDITDVYAVIRPVTDSFHDLFPAVKSKDNPDFSNACLSEILERINEHRLVRYGDQLFRPAVGQRPKSRAAASRKQ
jgi:hypothetical protein